MPKISLENVAGGMIQFGKMDLKEKESEFELIYKQQPNLLASILVLHQMGRSYEEMEVLFEVLLVSHLALVKAAVKIETVSEDLQERELKRYVGHVKFLDNLSELDRNTALKDYVEGHGEKPLMAYTINRLIEAGFPYKKDEDSKQLMLCGVNLVNCISAAKLA